MVLKMMYINLQIVLIYANVSCSNLFKKITDTAIVGYPKYTYSRLVERNPLEFTFIPH